MTNAAAVFFAFAVALTFTPRSVRAQTNTLVVPREAAASFGDRRGDLFFSAKAEQIYGPSEFEALNSDMMLITGVAFRTSRFESSGFNSTFGDLTILLGTFPGSVQEAVDLGPGNQNIPFTKVLEKATITIKGGLGETAFDVRFPFDTPYLFDRRRGALALYVARGNIDSNFSELDTQLIYSFPGSPSSGVERPYRRGAYMTVIEGGEVHTFPALVVTEFSVNEIFARIDSITNRSSTVEIDYTAHLAKSGLAANLESSTAVAGPFSPATDATISVLDTERMRAIIVETNRVRFFRVKVQ